MLGTLLYGLYRMIAITQEARSARQQAAAATRRAENAALLAADHAKETARAVLAMGEDIHKIEIQGNSNATRLEEAARAQGRLAATEEAAGRVTEAKDKVAIAEAERDAALNRGKGE
jgi:hypothetical protein